MFWTSLKADYAIFDRNDYNVCYICVDYCRFLYFYDLRWLPVMLKLS